LAKARRRRTGLREPLRLVKAWVLRAAAGKRMASVFAAEATRGPSPDARATSDRINRRENPRPSRTRISYFDACSVAVKAAPPSAHRLTAPSSSFPLLGLLGRREVFVTKTDRVGLIGIARGVRPGSAPDPNADLAKRGDAAGSPLAIGGESVHPPHRERRPRHGRLRRGYRGRRPRRVPFGRAMEWTRLRTRPSKRRCCRGRVCGRRPRAPALRRSGPP
jgi:hypothetical protein